MDEITQELAENKLLLLYIFNKIKNPITNAKIIEIVLDNNLINYFLLQQYLSELVSSGFLKTIIEDKKKYLAISPSGQKVLQYFEDRISTKKKDIVRLYFKKYPDLLKKQLDINADYFPAKDNNFIVSCSIFENGSTLFDFKLSVKSVAEAKKICRSWRLNALKYYDDFLKVLKH
ncbi:MAG: DUF4364 family protein [Clostridiales bacterium]|nr:DUF4364 family protein [Clostridiales bacterium]HBM79549.1 DUF4364 domain-containing protein [Clostridiaceae bacterium]